MKKDKKFTWADLKKAVNKIPEKNLKKEVIVWNISDESAMTITDVEILKEDYLFDGDEGCAPKSVMKEAIAEAKRDGLEDEYPVVHIKGTRVLNGE